jgi:hypothetical protein
MKKHRARRLVLAALALGLTTLAAPLVTGVDAANAAVSYSRECVAGADTGGRAHHAALCVYDDGMGSRFGRIAYRNSLYGTTVHYLYVNLWRCNARECQFLGEAEGHDDYLPINERMVVQTSKFRADYGWSYVACGSLYVQEFSSGRAWTWDECTPPIPGEPRATIIIG